jgi:hypothetical protein
MGALSARRGAWKGILASTLFLCASLALSAQELTLLGGALRSTDLTQSSGSWQLDYRQDFHRNFAASVAYINEGHLPKDHRDGSAFQVWGRLPLLSNRLTFSLGAGTYYFYDTQLQPGGGTANIHGSALILSAAATGALPDRYFYRFMVNHIKPTHELAVNTVVAGLGYKLGQASNPASYQLDDTEDWQTPVIGNEFTVFLGQSVVNTFFHQSALACAVEYRRGIFRHMDWTASLLYEGHPEIARRSGLATQAWAINSFLDERLTLGIGLGPYVYLDRKHPAKAGRINPAAIAPLGSLTVSARLSERWAIRLLFDRVTSNYNRDADIFLLGIGYSWLWREKEHF